MDESGNLQRKYSLALLVIICLSVVMPSPLANAATAPNLIAEPEKQSRFGFPSPQGPKQLVEYAFLIGDWTVSLTWTAPDGLSGTYGATWHNVWGVNGLAVVQEWRGPFLAGQEIRFYSRGAGHWVGTNTYPGSGGIKLVTAKRIGKTMVVLAEPVDSKRGQFINRETYFNITTNRFEMKSDRSYDNGTTWEKGAYSMIATRTSSGNLALN